MSLRNFRTFTNFSPCRCYSSSSKNLTQSPESELDEEPRKPKPIRDLRPLKHSQRAVYAVGLTKTGSFGIPGLLKSMQFEKTAVKPLRVSTLNTKQIRKIAAGFGFSLFATSKELYGAGLNNYYQCGGPKRKNDEDRTDDYYLSPHAIPLPDDAGAILSISAGRLHALVATTNGVYAFGDNAHGQCGQDPEKSASVAHSRNGTLKLIEGIPNDSKVRMVHCSLDTSFVLLETGELYAFGLSTDGQVGNGSRTIEWRPTLIQGELKNEKIMRISGSTDTLVAASYKGDIFIWGQNEYGQLRLLTDEPQIFYPTHFPFQKKIANAGATATSIIVTTIDEGLVYVWGSSILGCGPAVKSLDKPLLLDPPLFGNAMGENSQVEKVFAGNSMMAAVTKEGNLYTWGSNRFGGLGLSHGNDQFHPCNVALPSSVKTVSLGPDHTLFLTR